MRLKNSIERYGLIAILFHWIMAIVIIGLLAVGLYMSDLSASLWKLQLYGIHKEFGLLVLALAILRLCWRMGNVDPVLPVAMPLWQQWAAHIVKWSLVFFLFAMPITGWLLTSAAGFAPSFFGLFTTPVLIAPHDEWRHPLAFIHRWLSYALIATITVHALAALYHHFILKDTIFRRMLP